MAENDYEQRVAGRADGVRQAAVQAVQASAGHPAGTPEPAQELADEFALAAGRVRDAIDELRPATADDVRSLRAEIAALERRVAVLQAGAPPPAAQRKPGPPRRAAPMPPA